jgi:hypothetical protein
MARDTIKGPLFQAFGAPAPRPPLLPPTLPQQLYKRESDIPRPPTGGRPPVKKPPVTGGPDPYAGTGGGLPPANPPSGGGAPPLFKPPTDPYAGTGGGLPPANPAGPPIGAGGPAPMGGGGMTNPNIPGPPIGAGGPSPFTPPTLPPATGGGDPMVSGMGVNPPSGGGAPPQWMPPAGSQPPTIPPAGANPMPRGGGRRPAGYSTRDLPGPPDGKPDTGNPGDWSGYNSGGSGIDFSNPNAPNPDRGQNPNAQYGGGSGNGNWGGVPGYSSNFNPVDPMPWNGPPGQTFGAPKGMGPVAPSIFDYGLPRPAGQDMGFFSMMRGPGVPSAIGGKPMGNPWGGSTPSRGPGAPGQGGYAGASAFGRAGQGVIDSANFGYNAQFSPNTGYEWNSDPYGAGGNGSIGGGFANAGYGTPSYEVNPTTAWNEQNSAQREGFSYGGYGANDPSGAGNNSGGSAILCTAMNEDYGFGSFRQKIWLRQSARLSPAYKAGYHAIFRPLLTWARQRATPWQRLTMRALEDIAKMRTVDIWTEERRGFFRPLNRGRLYRAVLEPLCWAVGKLKGA